MQDSERAGWHHTGPSTKLQVGFILCCLSDVSPCVDPTVFISCLTHGDVCMLVPNWPPTGCDVINSPFLSRGVSIWMWNAARTSFWCTDFSQLYFYPFRLEYEITVQLKIWDGLFLLQECKFSRHRLWLAENICLLQLLKWVLLKYLGVLNSLSGSSRNVDKNEETVREMGT